MSKTFHKNDPLVINFHNTTTLKDPSRFWKIAWGPSRILSRILANIFMKYLTGSSKFLLQEFFKDFLTCGGKCTTCLSLRFYVSLLICCSSIPWSMSWPPSTEKVPVFLLNNNNSKRNWHKFQIYLTLKTTFFGGGGGIEG